MNIDEVRQNAEKRFEMTRRSHSYVESRLCEIMQEQVLHTLLLCDLVEKTEAIPDAIYELQKRVVG